MRRNKIEPFTDHDGSLMVIVRRGGARPLVYRHERLSARAAHGARCDACGLVFSKHDPHRVPLYDSVPLHEPEPAGSTLPPRVEDERLLWCQLCIDASSSADGGRTFWYSGKFNNTQPLVRRTR